MYHIYYLYSLCFLLFLYPWGVRSDPPILRHSREDVFLGFTTKNALVDCVLVVAQTPMIALYKQEPKGMGKKMQEAYKKLSGSLDSTGVATLLKPLLEDDSKFIDPLMKAAKSMSELLEINLGVDSPSFSQSPQEALGELVDLLCHVLNDNNKQIYCPNKFKVDKNDLPLFTPRAAYYGAKSFSALFNLAFTPVVKASFDEGTDAKVSVNKVGVTCANYLGVYIGGKILGDEAFLNVYCHDGTKTIIYMPRTYIFVEEEEKLVYSSASTIKVKHVVVSDDFGRFFKIEAGAISLASEDISKGNIHAIFYEKTEPVALKDHKENQVTATRGTTVSTLYGQDKFTEGSNWGVIRPKAPTEFEVVAYKNNPVEKVKDKGYGLLNKTTDNCQTLKTGAYDLAAISYAECLVEVKVTVDTIDIECFLNVCGGVKNNIKTLSNTLTVNKDHYLLLVKNDDDKHPVATLMNKAIGSVSLTALSLNPTNVKTELDKKAKGDEWDKVLEILLSRATARRCKAISAPNLTTMEDVTQIFQRKIQTATITTPLTLSGCKIPSDTAGTTDYLLIPAATVTDEFYITHKDIIANAKSLNPFIQLAAADVQNNSPKLTEFLDYQAYLVDVKMSPLFSGSDTAAGDTTVVKLNSRYDIKEIDSIDRKWKVLTDLKLETALGDYASLRKLFRITFPQGHEIAIPVSVNNDITKDLNNVASMQYIFSERIDGRDSVVFYDAKMKPLGNDETLYTPISGGEVFEFDGDFHMLVHPPLYSADQIKAEVTFEEVKPVNGVDFISFSPMYALYMDSERNLQSYFQTTKNRSPNLPYEEVPFTGYPLVDLEQLVRSASFLWTSAEPMTLEAVKSIVTKYFPQLDCILKGTKNLLCGWDLKDLDNQRRLSGKHTALKTVNGGLKYDKFEDHNKFLTDKFVSFRNEEEKFAKITEECEGEGIKITAPAKPFKVGPNRKVGLAPKPDDGKLKALAKKLGGTGGGGGDTPDNGKEKGNDAGKDNKGGGAVSLPCPLISFLLPSIFLYILQF